MSLVNCPDKYVNILVSEKKYAAGYGSDVWGYVECKICGGRIACSIYVYFQHLTLHTSAMNLFNINHGSAQISFPGRYSTYKFQVDIGFLIGIYPWILHLSFADDILDVRNDIMDILGESFEENYRYILYVTPEPEYHEELMKYLSSLNYYCGFCGKDTDIEFECMPTLEIFEAHFNKYHYKSYKEPLM